MAALQIDGPQIGELRTALFDAFTPFTFPSMLKERLNKDFDRYAAPFNNFNTNLFEIIRAANAEGWVADLIVKARDTVPGNPKLYAFAQKLNLTAVSQLELERYIGQTNLLLDANVWRGEAGKIEAQVCQIEIMTDQNVPIYGTGFLVGPDCVITNYHVMESVVLGEQGKTTDRGYSAKSANVVCRFDYKRLAGMQINAGTPYALAKNWQIDLSPGYPLTDPEPPADCLDYALIRLTGTPGSDPVGAQPGTSGAARGWIKIPDVIGMSVFNAEMPLFIMQHPAPAAGVSDGLLKLALDTKAMLGLNQNQTRVRYSTNTLAGSSGSPCFSQTWELIALHHSGDPNFDPAHKPTYNQGIPFTAIQALLKARNITL